MIITIVIIIIIIISMLIDRAYRALSGQNSPFLLDSKRSPGLTAGRILTKFGMNVVLYELIMFPDIARFYCPWFFKKMS